MEYGLLPHAFPDGSRHPPQAAISLDLRLERYSAYATRSQTRRTLQLLPSFAGWGLGWTSTRKSWLEPRLKSRDLSSIPMAEPTRFQGLNLVRIEACRPLCRGDYRTLATTPTGHPSRERDRERETFLGAILHDRKVLSTRPPLQHPPPHSLFVNKHSSLWQNPSSRILRRPPP